MSKFKVVDGQNITSIADGAREIKQLELEIQKKLNPSNKDLVVYAYHFVRLHNLLLAQKYLNRLSDSYFDTEVYRDLSRALLMWVTCQSSPEIDSRPVAATYEYFIILKRSLEMFDQVNFVSKPAFYRFRRDFQSFTKISPIK